LSSKRRSLTFCATSLALVAPIMSEQAEESGIDLDVSGLRAIDKDVARRLPFDGSTESKAVEWW